MFTRTQLSLAVMASLASMPALAETPSPAEQQVANILLRAPIVVTATRIEQNSFDLPVTIDTVDAENIREGQLQVNLSESIARVPGITVNNRQQYAQDLQISSRGFGARSQFGVRGVRLYEDGIPLSMPDGQGQTGTWDMGSAKRIEVLRGPFSALYGNSAGGVVQVFTEDGKPGTEISGGITLGSYGTQREALKATGQQGNINYVVSSAHYNTDGFRDHSASQRDTLHSKIGLTLNEDTKLTLVASYMNMPGTQDPLALTKMEFLTNPRQSSSSAFAFNTRVSKHQGHAGLTLEHRLTDSDDLSLMVYGGSRYNIQFQSTPVATQKNDLQSGGVAEIDRWFMGTDARWTHKGKLADKPYTLTAGMSYDFMNDDRKGYENFICNNPAGNCSSTSALGSQGRLRRNEENSVFSFDQYLQGSWDPLEKLTLNAGVRHSRVSFKNKDLYLQQNLYTSDSGKINPNDSGSASYEKTSPVIGALFHLTETANIYANYGKGFETPTFTELSYKADGASGLNFSLKPSRSYHKELGVKILVADNTRLDAVVFNTDNKDEIVVDTNSDGRATYRNGGPTQRKGFELSADSKWAHNISTYIAYSVINAKYEMSSKTAGSTITAGNIIPGVVHDTLYAEVAWKHPASGFTTALEGRHAGKVFVNDANSSWADGYTVLNWRGGFQQKVGAWNLKEFVRVDNLTDRKYVSSIKPNDANFRYYEPGALRNYLIGVSASYQF